MRLNLYRTFTRKKEITTPTIGTNLPRYCYRHIYNGWTIASSILHPLSQLLRYFQERFALPNFIGLMINIIIVFVRENNRDQTSS